jgi:organic radical activating enzyme
MENKVDGRSYTSNTVKLLKHLDKLEGMRNNIVSPVMIHIGPTNVCNLQCKYCCYGERPIKGELSKEDVKSALEQFRSLGTEGLEWTGAGEATMYGDLQECTEFAHDLGYKIGLITNAVDLRDFGRFDLLEWVRTSFHGLNVGKNLEPTIEKIRESNPETTISGVYIWTEGSEEVIKETGRLADKYGIPTRVTPDLTLGNKSIDDMMKYVRQHVEDTGSQNLFLSDFNIQTGRRNDHCYMHMIKPFIFPDGNVYVCPSAALSPENNLMVNERFKVATIETITEVYSKGVTMRNHDCGFCKYAQQNELIEDILTPTEHNSFA